MVLWCITPVDEKENIITKLKEEAVVNINSTDAEIRECLAAIDVKTTNRTSREAMIRLAEDNGVWENARGSIVKDSYKQRYGTSQSCDDEMAGAFKTTTWDLEKIKAANGIDAERWLHLNPGQQRMNLSNVLRGKMRRGEKVKIGRKVWNGKAKKRA